jgi:hypothetical protein
MEWKDFVPALNDKCLCLTPFCDEAEVTPPGCPATVLRVSLDAPYAPFVWLGMTTNNRCVLLEAREFDTLRPMKLFDSAILTQRERASGSCLLVFLSIRVN